MPPTIRNIPKSIVTLYPFNLFKFTNMKKRIVQFLTTYFLIVLLFVLQKPVFMAYYHDLYKDASWGDYLSVMWHGLPLDCSLAGYLTAIPGLLLIASVWTQSPVLRYIRQGYFGFIAFLMASLFIVDLGLYDFWGFRLDATPVFYFFSSPKDALASAGTGLLLLGFTAFLGYALLLYGIFHAVLIREKTPMKIPYQRLNVSLVMLLLTAALFIPIRGGFTVSTMNLSKVYFSQDQLMNHAAINPAFSFMYSATHQAHFDKQYRFLEPAVADSLFAELTDKPVATDTALPQLLTTQRPNIVLIILESFSSHLMQTLGGLPDVAVHMDRFAKEGVLFTHFYANSFRTDRGLASIISAYPGQPSTSIMKYPEKTDKLPSIPRSLKKAGYDLSYYYGGDADFTNMRSYLMSSGIGKIISDEDFPLSERTSKWGAHDHVLFQRLLKDLKEEQQQEPFLKIVQTSSSHEPFEVPFQKHADKVLNAFAYADSCVGDFIDQYRKMPRWDNTLFVLVPDHQGAYPHRIENPLDGHKIPLILLGGAVSKPAVIDTYASQIDIAATLFAQMGLPHEEFTFSKNILNPDSPHFAFFTRPTFFGMATADNQLVFNLDAQTVQQDEGTAPGTNLEKGKAFLQKLYDDLAKR